MSYTTTQLSPNTPAYFSLPNCPCWPSCNILETWEVLNLQFIKACHIFATGLHSLCNRLAISLQQACYLFASGLPSLCNRLALPLQQACLLFAISCTIFATGLPSLCKACVSLQQHCHLFILQLTCLLFAIGLPNL